MSLRCRITNYPEKGGNPCYSINVETKILGLLICYNGTFHPCVYPEHFPSDWPRDIAAKCVMKHEEYHRDDSLTMKCNKCDPYGVGTLSSLKAAAECKAYKAELVCIDGYPTNTPGLNIYKLFVEEKATEWCLDAGIAFP